MKCKFVLLGFVVMIALASGCKAPIDTSKDQLPAWAVGGTLHDALLPQWANGSDEDKLATAGEVLYKALWQGHLQTEEQQVIFRARSEKLVLMMNDFSKLYPRMVQVNPSVASWTARSFIRNCMQEEYDEIDKHLGPASIEVERSDSTQRDEGYSQAVR
jgi:hypothetical protein